MAYKFQRGEAILSGSLLQEGNVEIESGFQLIIGNAKLTEAELEQIDGVSAGTVAASKAVVVDSNKDASGFRNIGAAQLTTSGRVIVDDATEATSTTDGSLQTDGGLSVAKSAVIGDDLDLLSDAAIVNFGADKDVNLTHVADTGLLLNSSMQLQFGDSGTYIHQSADGVLDLVSDTEIEINATTVDINGAVDASSTITAAGRVIVDDTTEATSTTDGSLQTDGGLSVAKSAVVGDDLDLLSDAAIVSFGADKDVSLTHVADTGLLLNSSRQLQFGDSGTYIHQSADGVLDLVSDTEIEINATTVDINGAIDASSTIVAASSITAGTSFIIGSADLNETDLEKLDGITNGTAAASKAVVLDANKDVSGLRDISGRKATLSGSSSDELVIGSGTGRTIGVVIDGDDDFFRMGHSDGAVVLSASSGVEFVGGDEGVGSFGSDIKVYATQAGSTTNVSLGANGVISGSSKLEIGGTVRLDGVADAALDVAADSFYYLDAGDSLVKKDSMADYATAIAGTGIKAASGVLALDVNELSQAAVADGDFIVIEDATDNSTKKEAVADLASLFAGAGLAAASSVIAVANATNGGIGVHADNINVDLNDLAAADVDVANDSIAIVDANDSNGSKKESIVDLMTAVAGTGIKAASGVLALDANELSQAAVASGDFFVFEDATDNSTKKESVDDLATLFAGTGLAAASAVLSLDLNELSAASVNVANDSIAIIDADDSNGSKKESIADLVTAMAGAGLTATNGVLSVSGNDVHLKANGDTLQEGYNYFADIGDSDAVAAVSLPASPTVGDVVTVKAGDLGDDKYIRISRQGSHTIDGETSIDLESPFAAVTLVYVVADNWRVV